MIVPSLRLTLGTICNLCKTLDKNPSSRTAITLKEPFFNDNTYALFVTNDLNDKTPQDSLYRHINNVIIFNQVRPPNMKREDYIISAQKNAKRTKLFMNQHIADSLGDMPNATVVNYGVPLGSINHR